MHLRVEYKIAGITIPVDRFQMQLKHDINLF